jgi:hypothetical protein
MAFYKGYKHSPEVLVKMSESAKKRRIHGHAGHKHTDETKRKLSLISSSKVGEKASNWQGGKTKANLLLRWSKKNKDFRKSIFERDDFTCQDCGATGVYLEAHHIRPWRDYPELRYEVSNGITLCKPCHIRTRQKEEFFIEKYSQKLSTIL